MVDTKALKLTFDCLQDVQTTFFDLVGSTLRRSDTGLDPLSAMALTV
jgi:hypothetical protein